MSLIKQFALFDDDTGEIIKYSQSPQNSNLGKGWIAMYTASLAQLNKECPNFITMKVFIELCSLMEINKPVITTKRNIAKRINSTDSSVNNAFKWLKENEYIQEIKINGYSAFVVNPDIAYCGKSRDKERKHWITRSGAVASTIFSSNN